MGNLDESDAKLLGRIDANVQALLLSHRALELDIKDIQKNKADIAIVDKIESRLDNHLNSLDEIIASATRPYAETINNNSTRIDRIEKRLIRWGSSLVTIGLTAQIAWLLIQDKFKHIIGLG